MKKLFFVGACLLALASQPARAQTPGPAVAVVTSWAGLSSIHLLIDRGDGKPEIVDYATMNTEKGAASEAAALRQVVAKLYQEGYVLKASPKPTILIFVKEK